MYATIPVYYPSLEEAARKDEAALWCDSYNINMSCRNFIQDKAMTAFNTRELDAFIEELVRCYGTERAMYVLSRTIQFSDWDARFDQAVLDRAGKTDFPDTREPREAHQVASILLVNLSKLKRIARRCLIVGIWTTICPMDHPPPRLRAFPTPMMEQVLQK